MSGSDSLPTPVKVYISSVALAAIAIACMYVFGPENGRPHPSAGSLEVASALLVFAVTGFLAERNPISLPNTRVFDTNNARETVSSAVIVASLLLYGPVFTMVVAVLAVLASELLRRKAFAKVIFNVSQYALTVGVSGLFLLPIGENPHSFTPFVASANSILLLASALVAYFLMNTGLVNGVLAFVTGARFVDLWLQNSREILVPYAGMLNVGIVAAMMWTISPFALILLVLPLMVLQFAFRLTDQLKHETLKALIGVAEMVDARDSYAYRHSMEVARYSNLIATKLGLPLEEIEMINLAGMLHDIGKIGTPDKVLHKPGALDSDERGIMELHPSEGAKVLQYFSLFRPGADLVRYHQEHFDGSGYPKGLKGDEIPLGARIIHVADAYQAMTSDRVYRKALPVQEAIRRLRADAGKHFDPAIVDAMLDVLREQGVLPDSEPAIMLSTAVSHPPLEPRDVLGVSSTDIPDLGRGHA